MNHETQWTHNASTLGKEGSNGNNSVSLNTHEIAPKPHPAKASEIFAVDSAVMIKSTANERRGKEGE